MIFRVMILCIVGAALFGVPSWATEVRGAWITAWNKGFLTPAEADATIAAAKQSGLNTLFVQVRKVGDAYYCSTIEPRATELAADYDPLAYMINKGHAAGIKIHAWVNVFRVWKGDVSPAEPSHILLAHPEWITKSSDGTENASEGVYVDPANLEARQHLARVVEELARNYDLDGIHFDYIRYPGNDWGYSDKALERFRAFASRTDMPKPTDAQWSRWRRQQVTETLRLLRGRIKSAKPSIAVTAATIAWRDCPADFKASAACKVALQDWRSWLADGLLDANVPMNYRQEAKPDMARQFRLWTSAFKKWGASKPVWAGIDLYHNSADAVVKQIAAAKRAKLNGFVLFSFNDVPERASVVKALSKR